MFKNSSRAKFEFSRNDSVKIDVSEVYFSVKDLKTKRNWLAGTFLTILLTSLAAPLAAQPVSADEGQSNNTIIVPGTWYKLESNIVTVLFP